jgi:hypothetical protein
MSASTQKLIVIPKTRRPDYPKSRIQESSKNSILTYNQSQAPALRIPVIFTSDHEENHLAAYAPPNPRASSDTDRLLSVLDEIAVERLRAENFEEEGSKIDE